MIVPRSSNRRYRWAAPYLKLAPMDRSIGEASSREMLNGWAYDKYPPLIHHA
jgi:hypothetical protein